VTATPATYTARRKARYASAGRCVDCGKPAALRTVERRIRGKLLAIGTTMRLCRPCADGDAARHGPKKAGEQMNPNDPTKQLTPPDLANQLFDAALAQYQSDPREAARRVIIFLTEALVYTISVTAGGDDARKALLKSVGESIIAAPPHPGK